MKKCIFILLMIFSQLISFSQLNKLFPKTQFHHKPVWYFSPPNDTISGQWSYLNPMSQHFFGVNSYYIPGTNKIFICGGEDINGNLTRLCYFYNLNSNQYIPTDSLPAIGGGRAFGNLVMVGDSLYLVGSINSEDFDNADGYTFKFDLSQNKWFQMATMPDPQLQECGVCLWIHSDSGRSAYHIITLGGSTGGFDANNIINSYDPVYDVWTQSTNILPIPLCCEAAGCIGNNFIVLGGYNGDFSSDIYKGYFIDTLFSVDNIIWEYDTAMMSPFPTGVYRIGCGTFSNALVFGPASYFDTSYIVYNQLWGYTFADTSKWYRFLPNCLDPITNIATIATNVNPDSIYFYIFGGLTDSLNVINRAERFSYPNIYPFGIHKISKVIPLTFKLFQNYPNPFNPTTRIKFSIPDSRNGVNGNIVVTLNIFDILGRKVATLINDKLNPGSYEVQWDASNFASGVYFFRIEAGNFAQSKKMILIK